MRMPTVSAEARLRARNQLTVPVAVAEAGGFEQGDVFVVEIDAQDPDTVRLHRLPKSYAGALTGVYADVQAYLDEEHRAWEE